MYSSQLYRQSVPGISCVSVQLRAVQTVYRLRLLTNRQLAFLRYVRRRAVAVSPRVASLFSLGILLIYTVYSWGLSADTGASDGTSRHPTAAAAAVARDGMKLSTGPASTACGQSPQAERPLCVGALASLPCVLWPGHLTGACTRGRSHLHAERFTRVRDFSRFDATSLHLIRIWSFAQTPDRPLRAAL